MVFMLAVAESDPHPGVHCDPRLYSALAVPPYSHHCRTSDSTAPMRIDYCFGSSPLSLETVLIVSANVLICTRNDYSRLPSAGPITWARLHYS